MVLHQRTAEPRLISMVKRPIKLTAVMTPTDSSRPIASMSAMRPWIRCGARTQGPILHTKARTTRTGESPLRSGLQAAMLPRRPLLREARQGRSFGPPGLAHPRRPTTAVLSSRRTPKLKAGSSYITPSSSKREVSTHLSSRSRKCIHWRTYAAFHSISTTRSIFGRSERLGTASTRTIRWRPNRNCSMRRPRSTTGSASPLIHR